MLIHAFIHVKLYAKAKCTLSEIEIFPIIFRQSFGTLKVSKSLHLDIKMQIDCQS